MDKAIITSSIKNLIERNPIAIATITPKGLPNVIGVAFIKVVGEQQILVTDNFMHQTITDIQHNPQVAIAVWNKQMVGYKFLGKAQYFQNGKWFDKVKSFPENKGIPVKGAILVTINRIIKSALPEES